MHRLLFKLSFIIIFTFISQQTFAFALYGHRGARGLAPENTLAGYKTAIQVGVDYVDMDVAMTKDHVMVVQHDLALNPDLTRDHDGKWLKQPTPFIKQLRLHEVEQYDVGRINPQTRYAGYFPMQKAVDGTKIPTLKEAIEFVKKHGGPHVGFQIEIKTNPDAANDTASPAIMAAMVAKIIQDEKIIDRTQVQSFDWRNLYILQKLNPRIKTAFLTDAERTKKMHDADPAIAGKWTGGKLLKDFHGSIPKMVKTLGGHYWDPQDIQLTAAQVTEAHKLGLKVVAWSSPVSSGKDIEIPLVIALIKMGVDGIITDRPDIVRKIQLSDEG